MCSITSRSIYYKSILFCNGSLIKIKINLTYYCIKLNFCTIKSLSLDLFLDKATNNSSHVINYE